MIVSAPDWLQAFISFVNDKQLTTEPCLIHYLPHFTPEQLSKEMGTDCRAAYDAEYRLILIAGDVVERYADETDFRGNLMQSIGHEYVHHLQNVEGRLRPYSECTQAEIDELEDEAEGRGLLLVIEYFESIGREIGFAPTSERGKRICAHYGVPEADENSL